MRRFKELRKTISETSTSLDISGINRPRVGPMDSDNGVDFNQNLSQLNPSEVDRINMFLGALSAKPYLDPNQAIKEAQSKLSTVGLQFNISNNDDLRKSGQRVYPLSLFGGSFGTDGSTYDTSSDDNIERKLGHKLGLVVSSHPSSTGMTSLKAEILPM